MRPLETAGRKRVLMKPHRHDHRRRRLVIVIVVIVIVVIIIIMTVVNILRQSQLRKNKPQRTRRASSDMVSDSTDISASLYVEVIPRSGDEGCPAERGLRDTKETLEKRSRNA